MVNNHQEPAGRLTQKIAKESGLSYYGKNVLGLVWGLGVLAAIISSPFWLPFAGVAAFSVVITAGASAIAYGLYQRFENNLRGSDSYFGKAPPPLKTFTLAMMEVFNGRTQYIEPTFDGSYTIDSRVSRYWLLDIRNLIKVPRLLFCTLPKVALFKFFHGQTSALNARELATWKKIPVFIVVAPLVALEVGFKTMEVAVTLAVDVIRVALCVIGLAVGLVSSSLQRASIDGLKDVWHRWKPTALITSFTCKVSIPRFLKQFENNKGSLASNWQEQLNKLSQLVDAAVSKKLNLETRKKLYGALNSIVDQGLASAGDDEVWKSKVLAIANSISNNRLGGQRDVLLDKLNSKSLTSRDAASLRASRTAPSSRISRFAVSMRVSEIRIDGAQSPASSTPGSSSPLLRRGRGDERPSSTTPMRERYEGQFQPVVVVPAGSPSSPPGTSSIPDHHHEEEMGAELEIKDSGETTNVVSPPSSPPSSASRNKGPRK